MPKYMVGSRNEQHAHMVLKVLEFDPFFYGLYRLDDGCHPQKIHRFPPFYTRSPLQFGDSETVEHPDLYLPSRTNMMMRSAALPCFLNTHIFSMFFQRSLLKTKEKLSSFPTHISHFIIIMNDSSSSVDDKGLPTYLKLCMGY